ncbi:MAG TPA: SEC-C metal-binding domain-containing protein [Polyangiaceae bacterium]|jgi:hypothetical protein
MADADRDLRTDLRAVGERLPSKLQDRVLTAGPAAVPILLEILEDEELALADSPGEGWPPIHAVDLLADLSAVEAVEPLLRTLRKTSWDEILHDRVLLRLGEFGPAVLEPALREYAESDDADTQDAFCSVISQLGVRDERVWRLLEDYFQREPTMAANSLANYGDERALPLLERAIREFEPDWTSAFSLTGLGDLTEAYERIAGSLSDSLHARVGALREQRAIETQRVRAAAAAEAATATRPKVGRNDPCPCGSGKKYKKCCLAAVAG